MAYFDWDASGLPDLNSATTFSGPTKTISAKVGLGLEKIRQFQSEAPIQVKTKFMMTDAQFQTFRSNFYGADNLHLHRWFFITIKDPALASIDPIPQVLARFVGKIEVKELSGVWDVSANLEYKYDGVSFVLDQALSMLPQSYLDANPNWYECLEDMVNNNGL